MASTTNQPVIACDGQGVDPTAHIRYRAEMLIDASLHTVWHLQTDVENWRPRSPPSPASTTATCARGRRSAGPRRSRKPR